MAEEAMKESASMSTIAIMTMVFLPGTFVAVSFTPCETIKAHQLTVRHRDF